MSEKNAHPAVKEFLPEGKTTSTKTQIKKKFKFVFNLRRRQAERVHRALRPVLLVAQCIGIFPISGIRGPDFSHIRYSKYGIKTTMSLIVLTGSTCVGVPTLLLIFYEGATYRVAGDIMLFSSAVLSMFVFYKLAGRWKTLMERWAAVEDAMLGLPPVNISGIITILTAYFVCASICEHMMAVLYNRNPCNLSWEHYYKESFKQIFIFTDYALWKGLIVSLFNFLSNSAWNFTDLFIMALSIALGARFKQFNLELESVIHQEMDVGYWTKIREIYDKLALLTKLVDENVSLLILISFTNNLYFICLQLLHSIEPVKSTSKMIYTIISFGHLLFRACTVCLTAADVYDRSKAPIFTLFSVPSSSYNVEVQRMTLQVAFETLALTGYSFFQVTRTLMLTVAGTIATYEIVLLQFSNLSPDTNETTVINCSEYL